MQAASPLSHPQADFNRSAILLRPVDGQTLTGTAGLKNSTEAKRTFDFK